MRRRDDVAEVWWEVRCGEVTEAAASGSVADRWRMRAAWVREDRREVASMKIGDDIERE